jgi:catechol 2,3-dioxygenase-like lactoylglutathione lyase family enzyme
VTVSTPSLSGIHHLKIPVSDLAASLAWYRRVLGARHRTEFDHHSPAGATYAHIIEIPGLPALVELRTAPAAAAALSGFDPVTYLVATRAELQAWIGHLDNLGVDHSPELRGIIGWVLVVRDPDGLAIRLHTQEQHEFDEANADVDSPWLCLSADAAVVDGT